MNRIPQPHSPELAPNTRARPPPQGGAPTDRRTGDNSPDEYQTPCRPQTYDHRGRQDTRPASLALAGLS